MDGDRKREEEEGEQEREGAGVSREETGLTCPGKEVTSRAPPPPPEQGSHPPLWTVRERVDTGRAGQSRPLERRDLCNDLPTP